MELKFKKIVVLDNLLLFEKHKRILKELAEEVIFYSCSTPETIKELVKEKDRSSKGIHNPSCATELGIEVLAKEELARRVKGADCILTCWTGIPKEILEENPQLRYIGFWTHDKNKIGVPEAEAKGIKVTYIPDYGTNAVAELVFAGILNLARDIRGHEKKTLQGKWPYEQFKKGKKVAYESVDHQPTASDIKERTINGKTLGIIGMGRIGQKVAEIAKLGFGMKVIYYSKTRKKELEEKYGYTFTELKDVMKADIISIHLPPNTSRHFINEEMISKIKDDTILVNTAVGHVINQEALFNKLREGKCKAYLDVFDGLPPRQILKELQNNLLSTYRAGWYTRDSVTRKGDLFIEKLLDFMEV